MTEIGKILSSDAVQVIIILAFDRVFFHLLPALIAKIDIRLKANDLDPKN